MPMSAGEKRKKELRDYLKGQAEARNQGLAPKTGEALSQIAEAINLPKMEPLGSLRSKLSGWR